MRIQLLHHDKMQEYLVLSDYLVPSYRGLLYCYREENAWVELSTVVLSTGGFSLEGHLFKHRL